MSLADDLTIARSLQTSLITDGANSTVQADAALLVSDLNNQVNPLMAKTWQQIAVHDSAVTEDSFTFAGLNGNADVSYLLCGRWINPGFDADLMICPNGDLVQANYFREGTVSEDGQAPFSWRPPSGGDHPGLTLSYGGPDATAQVFWTYFIAKSGAVRLTQSIHGQAQGASRHVIENETAVWQNTTDNITSLQVAAFVTSAIQSGGIGAGSHFELWASR